MIAQPRALDTVVNTGWNIMLPPASNLNQNTTATVLDAVAYKVNIVINIQMSSAFQDPWMGHICMAVLQALVCIFLDS